MSHSRTNALQTLRHRNFRMLWIADSIAILGTQIQNVAITWQIFELTGDPFQLGLLGLFRFIPVIFFGLYGGLIADRRDRRSILIVTHVLLMLTTGVLLVSTMLGETSIWIIYGVTFLASAVNSFAGPARQAIIPALVPRNEVAGASTVLNLAMQTAQIGGPALGGILIGTFGLASAYAVGTVSFVAVIIAAMLITVRENIVVATTNGVTAVIDGLKFLWTTPILLSIMTLDFIATFFAASTVLYPFFAEDILKMGPDGLGLLLGAPAAGAVLGSLIMSVLPIPERPGLAIVASIIAFGLCIMGFGLSTTIWLSLLLLAGSGAADAISMAMRHTIRNLVTPPEYRGRIAAAHSTFAKGGPQLGELRSGAMASAFGTQFAVAFGGLATVVSCLVMVRLVPGLVSYRASAVEVEEVHVEPARPAHEAS
ncbi:MAG TPA: MFS transporter [Thermomicrobiales bacterium]|nr:MFS transporter [Thermomicrobiales bacterium]